MTTFLSLCTAVKSRIGRVTRANVHKTALQNMLMFKEIPANINSTQVLTTITIVFTQDIHSSLMTQKGFVTNIIRSPISSQGNAVRSNNTAYKSPYCSPEREKQD